MTVDDELLEALLLGDDDDLLAAVESLPEESIQPLLGMVGSGSTAEMPASVIEQAQELDPAYVVRDHLAYISDRITQAIADVEAGHDRKLLIAVPPRHGKTELVSVYLPLYMLRRDHKAKIGIISHSPNLAATWGRRVRRMVERHGAALGVSIASDAGAVHEWETPEGGGVTSRSIGQALAGVGFNVLIIDDPTRDFAAAHSDSARQSVWEWWTANAITRLEPPSLVIVVQTRWHEDDLSGRLLSPDYEGDSSEWEQIVIPAIADHDPRKGESDPLGREPGEPLLSPLVKDDTPKKALKRLEGLKRSVGSYAWAALFQQSPAPAQGAIFNVGWWRYWTSDPAKETPDGKVRYFDPAKLRSQGRLLDSWDFTFKATDSSDYVVGQRWAAVGANRLLLDQKRNRWTFTQALKAMLDWLKGGPYAAQVRRRLVEDKANGSAIIDVLRDKIPGIKAVNPQGSKEARARAATPEIEAGNVYLPDPTMPGYEWVRDFISETRSFPSGKNDDQVDAMTQALDDMHTGGRGGVTNPNDRQAAATSGAPRSAVTRAPARTVSRAAAARTVRRAGGR